MPGRWAILLVLVGEHIFNFLTYKVHSECRSERLVNLAVCSEQNVFLASKMKLYHSKSIWVRNYFSDLSVSGGISMCWSNNQRLSWSSGVVGHVVFFSEWTEHKNSEIKGIPPRKAPPI